MKDILSMLLLLTFSIVSLGAQDLIVPFLNKGKWGFMNSEKEIIVCPKYEEAYPPSYSTKLSRVKIKGKYGFIDMNGKWVIKPKYDSATDFKYGIAKVTKRGKTYSIKPNGKKNEGVIGICGTHPCQIPYLSESMTLYQSNDKVGFVHDRLRKTSKSTEEPLLDSIPPIFDSIVPISHQLMYFVKDSMIAFYHEGSIKMNTDYFMDNLSFVYQDIRLFGCVMCNEGYGDLIGFKQNGLWGYGRYYMGNELTEIIAPKYLSIATFTNGFAYVEYEIDKYGYIDANGKECFIR